MASILFYKTATSDQLDADSPVQGLIDRLAAAGERVVGAPEGIQHLAGRNHITRL